jgi:hypothetical protein
MSGAADITPWPGAGAAGFADPARNLFGSFLWFDMIANAARPRDLVPAMLTHDGTSLPLWCGSRAGALVPVAGLSSPYTLVFRPLRHNPSAVASHLMGHVRGVVRLDALDPDDPAIVDLEQAASARGLAVSRFDHFSNWFMPVDGDFERWLSGRPGALRNTIRRRIRAAGRLRFRSFGFGAASPGDGPEPEPVDLDQAVAQFDAVYNRSWKPAEPFAGINELVMRGLARAGVLRAGVLADADGPIAAQYWAISGGRAYLLKLAHVEGAVARSPGTVLTALMIRSILAADTVDHLDFGRGDDRYKRDWVSRHRTMAGLLLINPRSAAGLATLARARLGALRRARRRPEQLSGVLS